MQLYHLFLPAVLMGLSLAIDVAITTTSQFRNRTLTFLSWTLPVTFFHSIFMACGFYLFWSFSETHPWLAPILGVIGFLLVAALINEILAEMGCCKLVIGISGGISRLFGTAKDTSQRIALALALAWDAFLCGPAEAAEAEIERWTVSEMHQSLFIIALTIAAVTQCSLFISRLLRKHRFGSAEQLARWYFWGRLVELAVIGAFGMLSFLHGMALFRGYFVGNLLICIMVVLLVILKGYEEFAPKIHAYELKRAKQAIEG